MWYLQFHFVCAKLSVSSFTTWFLLLVFLNGWQTCSYSTKRRILFICIAKAFWYHRHCRWFSLQEKAPRPNGRGAFVILSTVWRISIKKESHIKYHSLQLPHSASSGIPAQAVSIHRRPFGKVFRYIINQNPYGRR